MLRHMNLQKTTYVHILFSIVPPVNHLVHLLPKTEWLGQYIFETIEEAQEQATEWLWTYNNDRPNMGIGGMTPAMKLTMAT